MWLRLNAAILVFGCSSPATPVDAGPNGTDARVDARIESDAGTAPDAQSGTLAIGATAVQQRIYSSGPPSGTLTTDAVQTASGSTFLVSVARGGWDAAPDAPTDSRANVYSLVGAAHNYGAWPDSATGLYDAVAAMGGADHTFSMTWGDAGGAGDEVSISAVEVRGAVAIEDESWVERDGDTSITSVSVTTSGPAMLVAWWWGSGGVRPPGTMHTAMPGDGFTALPGASGLTSLSSNGYIQVAAAYRSVDTAGTYTVSWTTEGEGAQLYLIALR